MPTYEYACTNGHRFEVVQRFSEAPIETCRECDAPVRRVFHPVGILLKGSGFYSTDNRSGKKFSPAEKGDKAEKKESKSASDGGSTPSKSSEGSSGSGGTKPSGSKGESA